MSPSIRHLNPSEAARRLGVSAKALRLYEQRGLIMPLRTAAGWRVYGPDEMARGAQIAALRALGLSLAQTARVLAGEPADLEPALAAHQAALEARLGDLTGAIERVRRLRADLARGEAPALADLMRLTTSARSPGVAFDLPWPWGGEPFVLDDIRALTWIIGPLGSGKTRLALRIAETLPDAAFLGLDRLDGDGAATGARLEADPALRVRVEATQAWLIDEGATASDALTTLLLALEADRPAALVVDMVEQGLDHATQEALAARLRHRGPDARPLVLMTRSSAMLDLAAVGAEETLILCPANHSPPMRVSPWPGAPGYEAVATCLASPEVRARTEGVIAWRPDAA